MAKPNPAVILVDVSGSVGMPGQEGVSQPQKAGKNLPVEQPGRLHGHGWLYEAALLKDLMHTLEKTGATIHLYEFGQHAKLVVPKHGPGNRQATYVSPLSGYDYVPIGNQASTNPDRGVELAKTKVKGPVDLFVITDGHFHHESLEKAIGSWASKVTILQFNAFGQGVESYQIYPKQYGWDVKQYAAETKKQSRPKVKGVVNPRGVTAIYGTPIDFKALPEKITIGRRVANGKFKLEAHYPAKQFNDKQTYIDKRKEGSYCRFYDKKSPFFVARTVWDATSQPGMHMIVKNRGETHRFIVTPKLDDPTKASVIGSYLVHRDNGDPVLCSGVIGELEAAGDDGDFKVTSYQNHGIRCPKFDSDKHELAGHIPKTFEYKKSTKPRGPRKTAADYCKPKHSFKHPTDIKKAEMIADMDDEMDDAVSCLKCSWDGSYEDLVFVDADGTGGGGYDFHLACPVCEEDEWLDDMMAEGYDEPCFSCDGVGHWDDGDCSYCHGSGLMSDTLRAEMSIYNSEYFDADCGCFKKADTIRSVPLDKYEEVYGMSYEELLESYSNLEVDDYKRCLIAMRSSFYLHPRKKAETFEAGGWETLPKTKPNLCVTCGEDMSAELLWGCQCCGMLVATHGDHEGCGEVVLPSVVVCKMCIEEGHEYPNPYEAPRKSIDEEGNLIIPKTEVLEDFFAHSTCKDLHKKADTSKPFFWNGMPENEFIIKSGEVAEWVMQYEYGPTEDWWVWQGDGPEDPDDPDEWGYVDTGAEGRYLGVTEFIRKLNGYSYDEVPIGNLDIDDKFLILHLDPQRRDDSWKWWADKGRSVEKHQDWPQSVPMEGLWTNEPTVSEDYDSLTFEAPYAGAGALMGIKGDSALSSFTPSELTESSAIHGDFDQASLNYSGHQNIEVRAENRQPPWSATNPKPNRRWECGKCDATGFIAGEECTTCDGAGYWNIPSPRCATCESDLEWRDGAECENCEEWVCDDCMTDDYGCPKCGDTDLSSHAENREPPWSPTNRRPTRKWECGECDAKGVLAGEICTTCDGDGFWMITSPRCATCDSDIEWRDGAECAYCEEWVCEGCLGDDYTCPKCNTTDGLLSHAESFEAEVRRVRLWRCEGCQRTYYLKDDAIGCCWDKNAETLGKDSCCCGATKSKPCACMKTGAKCSGSCACSTKEAEYKRPTPKWAKPLGLIGGLAAGYISAQMIDNAKE